MIQSDIRYMVSGTREMEKNSQAPDTIICRKSNSILLNYSFPAIIRSFYNAASLLGGANELKEFETASNLVS